MTRIIDLIAKKYDIYPVKDNLLFKALQESFESGFEAGKKEQRELHEKELEETIRDFPKDFNIEMFVKYRIKKAQADLIAEIEKKYGFSGMNELKPRTFKMTGIVINLEDWQEFKKRHNL